jgi:DNA-binding transcriptional MerR regulator
MDPAVARYRIGEVAERAGVTTRTLRYYQELGLLDPAGQSPGGSRRYSDADMARLLRIIELRDVMGLDLDRIRVILSAEDRLAQLREEAQRVIPDSRRREIVREAFEINQFMRAKVQEKLAVLQGFVAELDGKASRIRAIAEQLGVDLEPEPVSA